MENEEIIENPEMSTAGLTSAIQLVDTTDGVSFDFRNSSSNIPDHLVPSPFPQEKERREESAEIFNPLVSGLRFQQAFEDSQRKHKNILKKLAEY